MRGLRNGRIWVRVLRALALPLLVLLLLTLVKLQQRGEADHGTVVQVHHGYLGAAVMAAAPVLLSLSTATWVVGGVILLQLLGTWWALDDIYQHLRQFEEPFYRSPWHTWAHAAGVI